MALTELFDRFARGFGAPAPKPEFVPAPRGRGASVVAVRNDYKLETVPGPERSRRTHVFHDLGSFAEWLNRFGTEPQKVEILVGDKDAQAVLGDDPHASLVKCQLRNHPTFDAWQKALGQEQEPKVFHAFLRSVSGTFDDGSGSVNTGDVLSGELQKLKAVTTGDIDMNVDPRGFYTVNGSTSRVQVDAKIPPSFTIHTPIFVGIPVPLPSLDDGALRTFDPREERRYALEILLTMDVEDGGIGFTLTCPGLARVLHEARLDAVAHLRSLLNDGFLVGLGDLSTGIVPG